jgi:D-lyxose ketol-isomerase
MQARGEKNAMKRSEINEIIAHAEEDFACIGFALPPFAFWSPADWRRARRGAEGMVATGLGWDVTDFGGGRFREKGILLFTIRNGLLATKSPGNRPYAEKIMIARRDQLTPMHRHATKIEDIILRSALTPGAKLAVELFSMEAHGAVDQQAKVTAHLDGRLREVDPGSILLLSPGESITLFPGTYHAFWGEGGDAAIGEVSSVNDDAADNFFAERVARFADIDENEAPRRLLATDYRSLAGARAEDAPGGP